MQNKNHNVSTLVRVRVSCLCLPESNHAHNTGRNKNLIRFLDSFILLPILTVAVPFGSLFGTTIKTDMDISPTILLSQQKSMEANSLSALPSLGRLAFNQAMDEKAQTLETQAKAIDAYFRVHKLPLEGTGPKMAKEADKYGLDYRLMPAIAMVETTGGKNLCKKLKEDNNKNPFGWGSCEIGFPSFDKAIEVIAMNLSGNNPNTAQHYEGKTNKEILEKYNPPRIKPGYAAKVMRVMNTIGKEDFRNGAVFLIC